MDTAEIDEILAHMVKIQEEKEHREACRQLYGDTEENDYNKLVNQLLEIQGK